MGSGACLSDATIAAFWSGELLPAALAEVENHVDTCSACSLLLSEAFSTRRSTKILAYGANRRPRTFQSQMIIGGRYRIANFLGAGGMGEVYAADDLTLGEGIALKTVNAAISDDPRAIARLKAEVQLARRVTHRNVCRIFDFGVHENFAFLTMELLAGETLARRLHRLPTLGLAEALRLGRQIALGLDAAHQVGVIHRDLKPDNVIILADPSGLGERPVVTDFGLARMMLGDDPHAGGVVLGSRTLSGTPGYIAPERTRGQPASAASDIFALGVIMRDMAFGLQPSPGTNTNSLIGGDSSPSPDLALKSGPPVSAVRALIDRCTAFAPQDRPTSATAVVSEIDALLAAPDRAGVRISAAWLPGASRRTRRVAALVVSALAAATLMLVGTQVRRAGDARRSSPSAADLALRLPPPPAPLAAPASGSPPPMQTTVSSRIGLNPDPTTAAVPAPPERSPSVRRATSHRLAMRPGHEVLRHDPPVEAPAAPPGHDEGGQSPTTTPTTGPAPAVSAPPPEDAPIRLRRNAPAPAADDAPIRSRR